LENIRFSKLRKGLLLLAAGIISLLLGQFWDVFFPINKSLWTSSFVLFSGGWSLLLLGVFYLIIDVWGFRKWAFFFVVIGMNPITIYLVQNRIIMFISMRDFFFTGLINISPDTIQSLVSAIGYVACVWVFLYILYKKKIFLKV
jgi:predicted acyltransferase